MEQVSPIFIQIYPEFVINDSMQVKLVNDRTVQLQFDYGADLTSVISTVSNPLNDDEWHSIRANFDRKEAWLQVDSNGAERMTLPRPELTLELDGPLYIGTHKLLTLLKP